QPSPLPRHLPTRAGKPAVLFTTAHYSVTTSGHCSMVRSAISHLTVFSVPHVVGKWNTEANHGDNLKNYATRINEHLLKAARARKSKEWEHARALELRE